MRSGGSSLTRSISTAWVRAVASSFPYSAETQSVSEYRRQQIRGALPEVRELPFARERHRPGGGFGQIDERRPLVGVRHEGLKRLRQPVAGPPIARNRLRDEFADTVIGEPLAHLTREIDALTAVGDRRAGRDQRDHHVRRQLRDGSGNLIEHAIELARLRAGDEIGQRLQDHEDEILLHALAALFGLRDQPLGKLLEPVGVADDVEQCRHRRVVETRELAFEIACDDRVPVAGHRAGALAQDVAVINLPQFDGPAAGGHPGADDAPLGADVFGRPREQSRGRCATSPAPFPREGSSRRSGAHAASPRVRSGRRRRERAAGR